MGGIVSAGSNNDELVDHLVNNGLIRTPQIQLVFKAVDRGNYCSPNLKKKAYRDKAWRRGNLHLSAPFIYSEVMEALNLRPGLSFLNLGSGSGYLSTMAGLILGPYGINHGIELYSDIVDFAKERLDEFIATSSAIDEYDFCEPSFVVGNCLMLDSSCQKYDRVYCGASCPEEYEEYVKDLVKIGGILILHLKRELLKITRTSTGTWSSERIRKVKIPPLIEPSAMLDCPEYIKLGNICPPNLKNICRSMIRAILRKNIDKDNLLLSNNKRRVEEKHSIQNSRIDIPTPSMTDSVVSNQSQSNSESESEFDSDSPEFTLMSNIHPGALGIIDDHLHAFTASKSLSRAAKMQTEDESDCSNSNSKQADNSKEKESSDSKIDSENSKMICNESFISTIDEAALITKPNSMSTDSEKNLSNCNPTTFPHFNKSSCPYCLKTDETRRNFSSKRKRPVSDDQGPSSSSGKIQRRPRAATVECNRIIPSDSDSEMEKESLNSCAKINGDNTYTKHMVRRITDLPLPTPLLWYLNYGRNTM